MAADTYLSNYALSDDPVTIKQSERLKAQITVTGQFLFPGDPMSVVISKPGGSRSGLSDKQFLGAESQSLVNFLKSVQW